MKVWVLLRVMIHEGADVIGVYSAREKAEAEKARLEPDYWAFDFEIEEHEVDADADADH